MCVHARLQYVTRYDMLKKEEEEELRQQQMKFSASDYWFEASRDDSDIDEYSDSDVYNYDNPNWHPGW